MVAALGLGLISIFQADPVVAQDPVYEFSVQEMLFNKGLSSGNVDLQEWRRMRANILRDVSERGGVFKLKNHKFTADYLDNNTLKYNLYHSTVEDGNGRPIPSNIAAHQIGSDNTLSGLTGGVPDVANPNYTVDHEFSTEDLIVDFNAHSDYWVVVDKLETDRGVIVNYGNGIGLGSSFADAPGEAWNSYGIFSAEISSYEISPAITEPSVDPVQMSTASLNATSHKDAMGYYVVVAAGSTAPRSQQIVDGVDYGSATVVASGSFAMETGAAATADIEGLEPSTAYHAYIVGISNVDDLLGRRTLPVAFTTATNTAPSISGVAPQFICMANQHDEVAFTLNDSESPTELLTVTASSSNATLVADQNIVISGTGESRTVRVNPTAGETGFSEITLTVSDPHGSTSTASFQFNVMELPAAEVSITHATCSDNQDGSAQVSATGGEAPYTYEWSTGALTAELSELAPDTYTVEVTDAMGCKDSAEVLIAVEDEIAPIVECSNSITVCEGTFVFDGSVTAEDNCSVIVLQTAGPEIGSIVAPGEHTVVFTAEDPSGNTSTCSTIVDVVALPQVLLGEDATVPQGTTITLVAGNDPDNSYLWSTGETTAEITITVEEDSVISVTVTNATGCEASDEVQITADTSLGTSTSENGNTCTLYPNPGTDVINLSFGLNRTLTNADIAIYDLQGKQISSLQRSHIENGQVVSIDVSQLPQGLYMATITTDQERMTARFSKK